MKKLVSLLLVTVSLGLSGCATVLTAEQSAPQLSVVPQEKALTIAVIDKRPYVLEQDKEPKFEGIIRSSLGIPYSYNTATQQPMSQFLTDRLVAGLNCLLLALAILPAAAQKSGGEKADGTRKTAEDEDGPKSFTEIVENCDRLQGLFDFYQDREDGTVYLAIRDDQLDREYLHFSYVLDGLPALGLFRGKFLDRKSVV